MPANNYRICGQLITSADDLIRGAWYAVVPKGGKTRKPIRTFVLMSTDVFTVNAQSREMGVAIQDDDKAKPGKGQWVTTDFIPLRALGIAHVKNAVLDGANVADVELYQIQETKTTTSGAAK